jgi:hypothetical protein
VAVHERFSNRLLTPRLHIDDDVGTWKLDRLQLVCSVGPALGGPRPELRRVIAERPLDIAMANAETVDEAPAHRGARPINILATIETDTGSSRARMSVAGQTSESPRRSARTRSC